MAKKVLRKRNRGGVALSIKIIEKTTVIRKFGRSACLHRHINGTEQEAKEDTQIYKRRAYPIKVMFQISGGKQIIQ